MRQTPNTPKNLKKSFHFLTNGRERHINFCTKHLFNLPTLPNRQFGQCCFLGMTRHNAVRGLVSC